MYLKCKSVSSPKKGPLEPAVGGAGLQLLTNRQRHQIDPDYREIVERATKELEGFLRELSRQEWKEGFEVRIWNMGIFL